MDRSSRKNIIITGFILTVLSTAALFAGNDEELFLRGNKYYENHEYDKALQSYDMISKKGRAVLYNMGNCFYQKDEPAQALVYWCRAQVGAAPCECKIIAANKEHVLKKIGKNSDQSFKQKIKNSFNGIIPYFSLFFLQLFFLLCWCLFIFSVRSRRNRFARAGVVLLLFFIIVIATVLGIHYTQSGRVDAIVVKKDALIFAGPDKGFHALSPLGYAQEVIVKESREGWRKIRYADIIGWVEADVIQII
jgi:hypothetical protein